MTGVNILLSDTQRRVHLVSLSISYVFMLLLCLKRK